MAKQIIEQLQEDGRRPYATIGKAVGLSEAAVRQRVQRLLDSGVMQIVAVTDPLQLGFPRQAMIGLRTDGDLEAVADRLAELRRDRLRGDHRRRRSTCSPRWSAATTTTCWRSCNGCARCPGCSSTEAFVYLKLRKQTYTWGTA